MARARDPNRSKAKKLYIAAKGEIKLKEIADQLGLPEGTIRGWKNKDRWDAELNGTEVQNGTNSGTFPKNTERNENKTERSERKKSFREKLREQDIEDDGLTEKQRLFCLYYIKSFNGTMSAIKAGYEPSRAHVTASELVRNSKIAAEIRRLKGMVMEELFIDAMDVLERYVKIAFADMNDFVSFGQEEVPVMGMFGPVEVDDPETGKKVPLTQMVNVIRFKDSTMVDGGLICQVKKGRDGVSIKLEDRQKALDKLEKYFDLFPDKFQRRIEEEKLKLAQRKVGDLDPDEPADDGFIEALNAEAGKVWDDAEED
ncbi:MAG: terminase small subunit [Dehalobacter sp.]|nr:terminase small subunit [Dehalobacter sp.]